MSQSRTKRKKSKGDPNNSRVQDILGAYAAAGKAPTERRFVVFLAALAVETLLLVGSESDEAGEVITYAAICLRALFTGPSVTASDQELDEWGSRVQVMMTMESLQRRGYIRVEYPDSVLDPLSADVPVQVIGTWAESIRKRK